MGYVAGISEEPRTTRIAMPGSGPCHRKDPHAVVRLGWPRQPEATNDRAPFPLLVHVGCNLP